MADGPSRPSPPDPPDRQESTCFLPASKRRSAQKVARTSTNPPSTPLTPSLPQTPARPLTSELEAYAAGKARKRQATAGPEDRPSPPDPTYLGTPRSTRLKNLFTEAILPPTLLEVARKLNDLVENSVKLPKKGAEKISVGSETAADIKTLVVKLLELAEFNQDIPAIRRNIFAADNEEQDVERVLTGANKFGCKVPDVLELRLDQITKSLERIERVTSLPSTNFSFNTANSKTTTPSYALAASKHAPKPTTTPRPTTFRPVSVRKAPQAPPPAIRSMNTLTLAQTVKEGKEFANTNYPTLITTINNKIAEAMIKEKPSDERTIRIRSVHRHPSNDLVVYTTTATQAEILREQHEKWVPLVSSLLTLHNPVHTVVVHGIPTSFEPSDPQHLAMLSAMNQDTLDPPPLFVKWISANAVQRGATHSSIRIGFADANQANLAVEQKIFYGRFNKRTEHGRKVKPRCMNCLKDGHITRYCKETLMCPYCSEAHSADSCELHGKMTTNCTACARHTLQLDPSTNLKQLFAEAPRHLRHSPLDPTCPARIAGKVAQAAAAIKQRPTKQASTTAKPGNAGPASRPIVIPEEDMESDEVEKDKDNTLEDDTTMSPTC